MTKLTSSSIAFYNHGSWTALLYVWAYIVSVHVMPGSRVDISKVVCFCVAMALLDLVSISGIKMATRESFFVPRNLQWQGPFDVN